LNQAKLRDWLEIIGIFAVVASLIFVGLEMRQAQKISMSQAYQARTSTAADWNSAFAANPVALSAFRKASEGNEDAIEAHEYDALYRTLASLYYLYDNAHYQYQAGFVSEYFWESTRKSLMTMMEIPTINRMLLKISDRAGRPDFRTIVQEIGEQLEAQADEF
jgi:hypothetical protein